MRPLLITIDGPAGAGKTTVSKELARRLGYRYVDTGALYRGVALAAMEQGVAADDDKGLEALCRGLTLKFVADTEGTRLFSGDRDISGLIRTSEISMMASAVSALPAVRRALVPLQRRLGELHGGGMEGRDIGTVVLPTATLKVFLTASPDERARRRHRDLSGTGTDESLDAVREQQRRRDLQDTMRAESPLQVAPGSVVVDTTGLELEEVVERLLGEVARVLEDGA